MSSKYFIALCLFLMGCMEEEPASVVFPFKGAEGKFGAIDEKGRLVIPVEFDSIAGFYRERAIYVKDGKFGIISASSQIVSPPIFQDLHDFEYHAITYGMLNGQRVLVDTGGNVLCMPQGQEPEVATSNLLYTWQNDTTITFFDLACNTLFSKQALRFESFDDKMLCFVEKAAIVITNAKGDVLLTIPNRKSCPYYAEGFFYLFHNEDSMLVLKMDGDQYYLKKKNGFGETVSGEFGVIVERTKLRQGLYDRNGNILVEPTYVLIGNFQDGLAYVICENGKVGFINTKGELCIPCEFDSLPLFGGYKGNLVKIRKDSAWVFVDKKGEIRFTEP